MPKLEEIRYPMTGHLDGYVVVERTHATDPVFDLISKRSKCRLASLSGDDTGCVVLTTNQRLPLGCLVELLSRAAERYSPERTARLLGDSAERR